MPQGAGGVLKKLPQRDKLQIKQAATTVDPQRDIRFILRPLRQLNSQPKSPSRKATNIFFRKPSYMSRQKTR
jgi:hypothetical protein